ncbi:MAG: hypothetical protein WC838_00875 [Candidatus Margulisiibacteriota bacterium]
MRTKLLSIMILAILSAAALAVPNQLTYSGRLLQNGALVNSTLTMTFKIYKDPTSVLTTDLLWSTANITVPVNQGIYSVILDQVSPNVFLSENTYLEVIIGAETLAPRTQINSVGYALQAGGLSVGGYQAVTVTRNGNVGIRTANPIYPLHIARYQGSSGALMLEGNDNVVGMPVISFLNNNGGSTAALSWDGSKFNLSTGAYVNGNLGIGTTAAQATLNVVRAYPGSTGTFEVARFDVLDASGTAPRGIKILGSTGTGAVGFAKDTNADFQIWDDSTNPLLTIKNGGNIGIGTTNPGSLLDIKSASTVGALINTNHLGTADYSGLYMQENSVLKAFVQHYGSTRPADTTRQNNLEIGTNGTGPQITFRPNDTELMRLTTAGNVGIGITNPASKLHVNGLITYKGSNIGGSYYLSYTGEKWIKLCTLYWVGGATIRLFSNGADMSQVGEIKVLCGMGIYTPAINSTIGQFNNVIREVQTRSNGGWSDNVSIYIRVGAGSAAGELNWTIVDGYNVAVIDNVIQVPAETNILSRQYFTANASNIAMGNDALYVINSSVGIGTAAPSSKLQVVGLAEYADNGAAITAGLTAGAFYRTGDVLKVVH